MQLLENLFSLGPRNLWFKDRKQEVKNTIFIYLYILLRLVCIKEKNQE